MSKYTSRLISAALGTMFHKHNFELFDSFPAPERPDIENLKKQKKSKAQWKAEKTRTTFRK